MRLYQTIDGTLIGFYQEMGGVVKAVQYRDIYELRSVTKQRQEEVTIPGYWDTVETVTPGYMDSKEVYVQGHYDRQMVWHPEHTVTAYRWIEGKWETRTQWIPGYWESYTVTRPADPATGRLEISYEDKRWIPGYDYHRKVWVPGYSEPYDVTIPAGERDTRVWVDGEFVTEEFWVKEVTTSEQVWIEPTTEFITVDYQVFEDVYVGREPIYEYVDPMLVQGFEVLELIEGAGPGPEFEDVITIRNTETGEVLKTTATYIGLAEQIDLNEYVVP